jgi:hypothetical protein
MARTYHHGIKARARKFGDKHSRSYPQDPTSPKRRRTKHHLEWMNTPGWWIRQYMTRPQRSRTQAVIAKVFKLADLEDAPEFPLAKKPFLYFW